MKQILQNLSNGATEVAEIPCPQLGSHELLIQTNCSLVSAGTERMLVEFGKANILEKIRKQPDKVKMVLDKLKTDGLLTTINAVRSKLDQPLAMGYCNVGQVIAKGENVTEFAVGDWVVSNGPHAEYVCVAKNLCAKLPPRVDAESASFTVIAAIALQGIRIAAPTLGEGFVVIGLGLIGLLAVQLLRANGCRVLGIDFDQTKLDLASAMGAEVCNAKNTDVLAAAEAFSRGQGVDGVLICAATQSSEPIKQAAQMSRKRGRIVLVGVTGLELSRADFYEKELSFQVSCSYGPGRYDPNYEIKGQDYPLGFVRWTEQRNFVAVLDMLSAGKLDVTPLISHRYPIEQADAAYGLLSSGQPYLGIILTYANLTQPEINHTVNYLELPTLSDLPKKPVLGFIGAGNYTTSVLLPAFKRTEAVLHTIASKGGVNSAYAAKKFGFSRATTATEEILNCPDINTVVITTRHNSHAYWVSEALKADKQVFVEKPLALTLQELAEIEGIFALKRAQAKNPILMVGFNRRFAPHVLKIQQLLANVYEPKVFIMTINAGFIPNDHWTQNRTIGGGRILGEACHFIDLLRHLSGHEITSIQAHAIAKNTSQRYDDKVSITLQFADGSLGSIHYLANGHKAFPKERLEIFCAGKILQLDNYRKLKAYGWNDFKKLNLFKQDKGQNNCVKAFIEAASQGKQLIAIQELFEVSRFTIEVAEQLYS